MIAALLVAAALGAEPFDFERGTPRPVPPASLPDKATGPEDVTKSQFVREALLQLEFKQVATPGAPALVPRAVTILGDIKRGEFEAYIADAWHYEHSAAGWEGYTRTWLASVHDALASVTPLPDKAVLDGLSQPSPSTGMPGRATVAIGDAVPKPTGAVGVGPDRWTVEFMWLGQVMPVPNRGLFDAPGADRPGPGAWHLSAIHVPWSLPEPGELL